MSGGYTLALATDQAHSGTHSVHVMAPAATGAAQITETRTFPATDFWGRAWLRFSAAAGGHQMYIAVNGGGDQLRLLNRLGNSSAAQVNFQRTDMFYASRTMIPMDTWFCYEWHVSAADVHVYMNGQALTDVVVPVSIANPTALLLGFQRFQAGPSAGEIWIDDVAVNASQIGCN